MPNMTFALSPDLHHEMRSHPEIKWADIAREAIRRELERIHLHDELLAHSRITGDEAVQWGRALRRRRLL